MPSAARNGAAFPGAVAPARVGIPAARPPSNALQGRDGTVATVSALLARAATGRGGSLVLQGDPGSGRTALLAHARDTATGWTVLSVAGVEAERAIPAAGLQRLFGPAVGDGPAVLEALRGPAADRPVLCCVDDAQWLDAVTLEALAFAARRCGEDRVALLLGGPAGLDPLRDLPASRLEPLDAVAGQQLLSTLGVPRDLVATVLEVGCGNPQALVDLAGALAAAAWTGTVATPVTLPAGSRSWSAHARLLQRYGEAARRLLLIVAADDRLTEDELAAAAEALGLDLAELAPAERDGVLVVRPDGVRLAPDLLRTVAYHAATMAERRGVHGVLARSLPASRDGLRVLLHRALGVAGPQPRLAAHLAAAAVEGADHLRAARALERASVLAGEPAAAEEYRLRAAERYWRAGRPHQARQLLDDIGGRAAPLRVQAAARVLSSDIELSLGPSADAFEQLRAAARDLSHGDRQVALHSLLTVSSAVVRLGHEELLTDVARRAATLRHGAEPPEEELAFEQLTGMAAVYGAKFDVGVTALRRVLALAAGTDRTPDLLRAAFAAILVGDDAVAHRMAARAEALARARGEVTAVPQAGWLAALADFALGRYAEATERLLTARDQARACGLDGLVQDHTAMLAVLAAVGGDRAAALAHVAEGRADEHDHPGAAPILAGWALSVVDLIDGRAGPALQRLTALAGPDAPPGHQIAKTALFVHWVEAAARAGQPDLVAAVLPRFTEWTDQTGNPGWQALAARARALLSADDAEADAAFAEAHRLHVLAGTDLERARTDLLRGQRLRRRRQPRAARTVLRAALETFERMGATGWAEHARDELRAAGERIVAAPTGEAVSALTAQQRRIARFVAAGATNAEIAAQLFVSVRTVDYHLSKIYARLGIRSRVELAGYDW